jgi:hypothetical protein
VDNYFILLCIQIDFAYLEKLSVTPIIQRRMIGELVANELENIWQEPTFGQFEIPSRHSHGVTEEGQEKHQSE